MGIYTTQVTGQDPDMADMVAEHNSLVREMERLSQTTIMVKSKIAKHSTTVYEGGGDDDDMAKVAELSTQWDTLFIDTRQA